MTQNEKPAASVAILARGYFPNIGGIERHVKEIATRLSSSMLVEVFTIDGKERYSCDLVDCVTVRRFRPRNSAFGIEVPPKELYDALCESRPDIIHVHGLHTMLPALAARASTRLDCKLVITTHYHGSSADPARNLLLGIYKKRISKILAKCSLVACVSEFEKSLVLKDFGVDPQKTVVIPNGVEVEVQNPSQSPTGRDAYRLLFVGRLEKYKNADKVIEALSLLKNESRYCLTIVGDGPQRKALQKISETLGLGSSVEFKKNLSDSELAAEYRRAGILVLPSKYESHGISVAEALSYGSEAIVADSSALSEFVSQNFAYGISLPVTPKKIAQAILHAQGHSDPRSPFRAQSWSTVANRIASEYRKILSATPKASPPQT